MNIIGYNCHIHDSAAALVKDGKLIAASEEERLNRQKHYGGFPVNAIKFVLDFSKLKISDIDYVAFYWKPFLGLHRRIYWVLRYPTYFRKLFFSEEIGHAKRGGTISTWLKHLLAPYEFKKIFPDFRGKFVFVPHHFAHAASAFFVSPFKKSAILSIDYSGEWVSTFLGYGVDNKIFKIFEVGWPHSLGYFYTAVTQYLGFGVVGDEYKVMGLSAYGSKNSKISEKFKMLIYPDTKNLFRLNLKYFGLHRGLDTWYSPEFEKLFGPARKKGEKITQYHADIAYGLQRRYEEIFFHIAKYLKEKTNCENLSLAGGCGLNSVANGLLLKYGIFKEIFVQPAANDAGCSLGAAFYLYNHILNNKRKFIFTHSYWGPEFNNSDYEEAIKKFGLKYKVSKNIAKETAELIANKKIVGFFQGRMEWGPRALGNRSILADPRDKKMKDRVNIKVKHREEFRPFAPSILEEWTSEYFDYNYPCEFMLFVYNVTKPEKIPAVTHVDGTGRLQTVNKIKNPLYWNVINEFRKITKIPVVLNTSFNDKDEPIVCSPEDALRTFMKTGIDYVVMGNYIVSKKKKGF